LARDGAVNEIYRHVLLLDFKFMNNVQQLTSYLSAI